MGTRSHNMKVEEDATWEIPARRLYALVQSEITMRNEPGTQGAR
jgi:hypothetical protein